MVYFDRYVQKGRLFNNSLPFCTLNFNETILLFKPMKKPNFELSVTTTKSKRNGNWNR
jgi:hypothetical protein